MLRPGQAGLGLGLAPQLVALAGCGSSSANTVTDASGGYDAIIIGGGTAGAPFQLPEVPFTWQGIGLGGNAMFNGMLFQTTPSEIFA